MRHLVQHFRRPTAPTQLIFISSLRFVVISCIFQQILITPPTAHRRHGIKALGKQVSLTPAHRTRRYAKRTRGRPKQLIKLLVKTSAARKVLFHVCAPRAGLVFFFFFFLSCETPTRPGIVLCPASCVTVSCFASVDVLFFLRVLLVCCKVFRFSGK